MKQPEPLPKFDPFIDKDGNRFDPKKKFGNIEEAGHKIYGEDKNMVSSY